MSRRGPAQRRRLRGAPARLGVLGCLLFLGLLAGARAVAAARYEALLAAPASSPGGRFEVRAGESVRQVAARLQAAGFVRSGAAFVRLARRQRLDRRLQTGWYRLEAGLDARGVLAKLASGEVLQHKITVPEGLRLEAVAERVEAAGIGSASSFLRLVRSDAASFGVEGLPAGATLEGYLFPETYFLPWQSGERELVQAMVQRFVSVWRELTRGAEPARPRHEIVTIASLVEREAKLDSERAKVAGVIENRLRRGQKLEFCSTVIYALGEPRERLLLRDLQVASPYNTYRIAGLPPGPICSPGRASLEAALRPARHDYYYFVLDEDGRHIFSRTGAEHNRARRVAGSQRGR